MRRVDFEVVVGAVLLLLCAATGVPVVVAALNGRDLTNGPGWLWASLFVAFLAVLATTMVTSERPELLRTRVLFGAQVILGPFVVLLAPAAGWTGILLVFTAALAPEIVRGATTALVVVVNTIVAAVAGWLASGQLVVGAITALVYVLLQTVTVLAVISQRRGQESERALAQAHTELRATTALLAESTRSTERLRIARDLHDVIGHQVTALALELEVATHLTNSPATDHVSKARAIAKDLLSDLRATVDQLRATQPELEPALREVVSHVPRPQVHLSVSPELDVDEDRHIAIVRCVQEITTNAIRHSRAENLWIDLTLTHEDQLVLTAHDDGRGTTEFRSGNGLTGMCERIEDLKGTTQFATTDGFRVTATLPAT